MRTRYYNVDLKRFMNRDVVVGSVSSAQSLNRYAYVNGNPISYTDPFGMARETLEQTQGLAGFDIHLLLDVAGMFPVIGEFADATNAVLYLSKGQYVNAALSGAAMVPFAGNFVTGGKLGVKASGMLSSSKEALRRTLNSVLDFKFNVGRSTALAGYGRVSNDVSIRDTYQYFKDIVDIQLSRSKYPESSKHIEDAIKDGHPDILTINRPGAKNNRKNSLKGKSKVSGKDLDEYPMAVFEEGGTGASVRAIDPSDNRGAGSSLGHKMRPYPNGTKIRINIVD